MSDDKKCFDFGGRTEEGQPCRRAAGYGRPNADTGRCKDHRDGLHAECSTKRVKAFDFTSPEEGPVRIVVFHCSDHGRDVFRVEIPDLEYRTEVHNLNLMRENGIHAIVWPFDDSSYSSVDVTASDFETLNDYMDNYKQTRKTGCSLLFFPFFMFLSQFVNW